MPGTVRIGSSGATVRLLQTKLNGLEPTVLPRLSVDGMFGPKTLARVLEVQRHNRLVVDGVVGPRTWDTLLVSTPVSPLTGVLCANGVKENAGLVQLVASNFLSFLGQSSASNTRSSLVGAAGAGGRSSSSFLFSSPASPFAKLTPPQIATAMSRYGSSIEFAKVFISPLLGLGNRAFTAALTVPPLVAQVTGASGVVQIMNLGTMTPAASLLLHELAHVWQSQHDSDPKRFMRNSVNCQKLAVEFNGASALTDPGVRSGDQFPVHFPTSAYAYKPGKRFASYSCEQMANNLDHGDPTITAHVKGAPPNVVDADNIAGLSATTIDDRRAPGVVF